MIPLSNNSRYQLTPTVVGDGPDHFAEWVPLRFGQVAETIYTVKSWDLNRPDLISYRNYGSANCDLWWAIMFYNGIVDPFSLEVGDKLRIPSFSDVSTILTTAQTQRLQLADVSPETTTPATIPVMSYPVLPPYQRLLTPAEIDALNSGSTPTLTDPVVAVFDLLMAENLVGLVHFQLQISLSPTFDVILLNRFTLTTQVNWYFYNPSANNLAGGYMAFPTNGIDGVIYAGQRIYLNLFQSDNLVAQTEYYARYRTWVDNVESQWYVNPPFIF